MIIISMSSYLTIPDKSKSWVHLNTSISIHCIHCIQLTYLSSLLLCKILFLLSYHILVKKVGLFILLNFPHYGFGSQLCVINLFIYFPSFLKTGRFRDQITLLNQYFGQEYATGSIASIALYQEAITSADLEMLLLITGLSFCPIH